MDSRSGGWAADDWNIANRTDDWFNESGGGGDWFDGTSQRGRGRSAPHRRGGGGGRGQQAPRYYENQGQGGAPRGGGRGRGRGKGGARDWFDRPPRNQHSQHDSNPSERRTIAKRKRDTPVGNNTYGSQASSAKSMINHRMVFDETGVARKRVRGGRIAKVRKVRAPDPDLYCEVCNEYQYDENSKAGHDRGRKHLLKLEELRMLKEKEAEEKAAAPEEIGESKAKVVSYENEYTMSPDKVEDNFKKAMAVPDAQKPHGYLEWFKNSVEQAKIILKVPAGTNDDDRNEIMKEVLPEKLYNKRKMEIIREIKHTTATLFDNGTWLITTWKTYPLATGKHYASSDVPKPLDEMIVPEAMVESLKEPAPIFIQMPETPTPAPQAPVPVPMEMSKSIDVDMIPAVNDQKKAPSMVKIRNNWRVSGLANHLVKSVTSVTATINRQYLFEHAYEFIGRPPAMAKKDAEPKKDLEDAFKKLESQFEGEEVDCAKTFNNEVLRLIAGLEEAGHQNNRRIQKCCEMMVRTSVQSEDWTWVCSSLDRLMKFYRAKGVRVTREYVSYWIVSLLMRAGDTVADGHNDSLDMSLSTLPRRFMKFHGVRHSLAVLRAVLTNNHVRFFEISKHSDFHAATEDRSQLMMGAFVDVVRQQALWQWATPSPERKAMVYFNPVRWNFARVVEMLNWTEMNDEDEIVPNVDGAKEQVMEWGLTVAKDEVGDMILDVKKKEPPTVKRIPHIDVATIFGFMNRGNAVRVE